MFVTGYNLKLVTGYEIDICNRLLYIDCYRMRCRAKAMEQAKLKSRDDKSLKAPKRSRMHAHREKLKQAGLKRVELFVPEEKVDQLKAYAANLRRGDDSERLQDLRKLIKQAYSKFHARYLDNIFVDPEKADFSDAAIVAAALMNRAGSNNNKAYVLGQQLRKLSR